MFCLDFVCACCTKIPVDSSTTGWVVNYWTVIQQFVDMYTSLKVPFLDGFPQNIFENSPNSVKQYFSWIQKLYQVILSWKTNLDTSGANYDEIHVYSQMVDNIGSIAHVSATGLVVLAENLKVLKKTFLEKYEELNIRLLKYVPGNSKLGW